MRSPATMIAAAARNDLTRYWLGQTTSAFGGMFTAIAVPIVAVVYLRVSTGQLSLITATAMIPTLVFGLPAGALADRITRPRRTLMLLDTLCAVAVGTVAVGLMAHVVTLGWLIVLALIGGGVGIIQEVIYMVHLRQVTGSDGLGKARARLQAGEFAAGFAGRLVAGPVIVAFGPGAALAVDAVSYLLSATALLSMRPVAPIDHERRDRGASPSAKLREALSGMTVFTQNSYLRLRLIFTLVPAALLAGVSVLTAPFLLRVIHVPPGIYGLSFALAGLAGLAGSILAPRVIRPAWDSRRLSMIGIAVSLIAGLLLPAATGPLPVALTIVALGSGLTVFFGAFTNIVSTTSLMKDLPEAALGRALAFLQVTAAGLALLGALGGGLLGEHIGVRTAIWVLDGGALGVICAIMPPAWRAARRLGNPQASGGEMAVELVAADQAPP